VIPGPGRRSPRPRATLQPKKHNNDIFSHQHDKHKVALHTHTLHTRTHTTASPFTPPSWIYCRYLRYMATWSCGCRVTPRYKRAPECPRGGTLHRHGCTASVDAVGITTARGVSSWEHPVPIPRPGCCLARVQVVGGRRRSWPHHHLKDTRKTQARAQGKRVGLPPPTPPPPPASHPQSRPKQQIP
jgi:hypothetical protein